ncbi:hypothetical protein BSL82_13790 [Tardibacter chloracetimidivorans]|uniref:Uncharacterized protein n=1 Tax=Tardibacter chloracetimidivorans TaxID=1921510 RepID=A0A1L3ZX92_9SPHN|nr:hypothetical protein [Tardibacter chloracetimidivorans]API60230.1 hypothetical protein BSL82_13790 [Tardibacter chloracetimidivorans]
MSRTNINLDAAEAACKEYGLPYHRQGSSLWDRDDISAYTAMMTFWMSGGADMLSQALGLLGFDRNTVNGLLSRLQATQLAFRRGHVPDVPGVSSEEGRVLEEMSRAFGGSVAKIVKLEHAWRRLNGWSDDGFQVAPFPG